MLWTAIIPFSWDFRQIFHIFSCLVSKYQNGDCRAFLCCQAHISVKEIYKVCGSGKSGLFCPKVDLDFGIVTFVNTCECCLRKAPCFWCYRLLRLHLLSHSWLQPCLLFLKRNKAGGNLQHPPTHLLRHGDAAARRIGESGTESPPCKDCLSHSKKSAAAVLVMFRFSWTPTPPKKKKINSFIPYSILLAGLVQ